MLFAFLLTRILINWPFFMKINFLFPPLTQPSFCYLLAHVDTSLHKQTNIARVYEL